MECLYLPNLDLDQRYLELHGQEAHHARVLRLRPGDRLLLSNGKGTRVLAQVEQIRKAAVVCRIIKSIPEMLPWESLIVAPAMLHDRSRWEFVLEKSVELGATQIVPLAAQRCVKRRFNQERAEAKLIAALKQAQRARLPALQVPMTVGAFLQQYADSVDRVIVAYEAGKTPMPVAGARYAICIGPEGGWTPEELRQFAALPKVVFWKLSALRLRSETAVVAAIALLWHQVQKAVPCS